MSFKRKKLFISFNNFIWEKRYYLVFIIKINEEELGIFISEGFVNYLKYKYKENWLYFYVYL